MKKIYVSIIILSVLSLPAGYALYPQENTEFREDVDEVGIDYKKIVAEANIVMKNIYNELWMLKGKYKELKNFGPQNYSDTPEMTVDYQGIKSIRLESTREIGPKRGFFTDRSFRGDRDEFYICFSDTKKAFGVTTLPNFYAPVKHLGLYLLIFTTTENRHLEHDLKRIIKNNMNAPSAQ